VSDTDAIRNPQVYLFTVANNLLKEHGLRERKAQARSVDLDDRVLHELPADLPPPETGVDLDQRAQRLRAVLDELPANWRNAVILQYRYELGYEEIGHHLGVSPNMVKKYLAQALSRCRRRMARWE
jgi:RNA polymerase sigma factor (sigma-70 family)